MTGEKSTISSIKLAGVCTAYHEADIIGMTVRHMFAEGCDAVYVERPDGDYETWEQATNAGAKVITLKETFHDQPGTINYLARCAAIDLGEDNLWILPFDADEFFYAPMRNETIKEALSVLDPRVASITAPRFKQHDWWHSEPGPSGMSKVAYRWTPDVKVGPGNHTLTGVDPDSIIVENALMLREYQYRSFEHFKRKVEERSRTIDPSFGSEMGWHIRQYVDLDEEGLRAAYEKEMDPTFKIWAPLATKLDLPLYPGPRYGYGELREEMSKTACDIAGHLQRLHDLVYETGAIKRESHFLPYGRVLECGTNTGMSTIAFLSSGADVWSVDHADVRRTVRPEVLQEEGGYYDHQWHLSIADDQIWESPFPTWRLIFIDTSHTYRHSMQELEKYWPMVESGGAMVWHDALDERQNRAHRHWLHTVDDVDHTEFYAHDNGLVVYWKKWWTGRE